MRPEIGLVMAASLKDVGFADHRNSSVEFRGFRFDAYRSSTLPRKFFTNWIMRSRVRSSARQIGNPAQGLRPQNPSFGKIAF